LLVVIALAACNPYDKDLGPEPFFCGSTNPRCPMGYVCVQDPNTSMNVCAHAAGSGSGSFQCADDSAIEPNDTLATATPTSLDTTRTFQHGGLAICPSGDRDNFALVLASAGESVEATVAFDPTAGALHCTIANAAAIPVSTETAVADMPGTIRAFAQGVPEGMYYVQVFAAKTVGLDENNYSVTINVTGP
jgi:hypothetical protein